MAERGTFGRESWRYGFAVLGFMGGLAVSAVAGACGAPGGTPAYSEVVVGVACPGDARAEIISHDASSDGEPTNASNASVFVTCETATGEFATPTALHRTHIKQDLYQVRVRYVSMRGVQRTLALSVPPPSSSGSRLAAANQAQIYLDGIEAFQDAEVLQREP